jgi:type IV pilus assembly protein PilX
MKPISSTYGSRRDQSGVSLIVVLLLLVIVTLLGIASMRGAIMQERMAANTTARSMAFQVAEAGLRQAEKIARDAMTIAFPASGCNAGLCKDAAWMADTSFWSGGAYKTGTPVSIGTSEVSPKFIIEDFGKTSVSPSGTCVDLSKSCMQSTSQKVYRITSYATTPTGAEVILQSIYRR